MLKTFGMMSKKAGLPPGTPIHIGKERVEKVKISIIDYDEIKFQEKEVTTVEECYPFRDSKTITWIDISGLHEIDIIEKIGNHFNLHPLVLEDIVNTEQRPKFEDFDEYIFIVIKMLSYNEQEKKIEAEHVSLILGSDFIISFQERPGDVFDHVRERIRNKKGRIRKMGADYLAYAILDTIIDNYFSIFEILGDTIEFLEDQVIAEPTAETVKTIHELKNEMILIRKAIWPLREVVSALERGDSELINKSTIVYLRDAYDHTIQIVDVIDTSRDMLSGMLDVYLSSISNKMNEVMKTLTIIATIFIPMTFFAGVYGMNFKFIPELEWRWGYPGFWMVIVVITLCMFIYFRRKKWL